MDSLRRRLVLSLRTIRDVVRPAILKIPRPRTTEGRSLQILLKELKCTLPGQFGGLDVVAWGGVIVKAVLFAFVGERLKLFLGGL